MAKIKSGDNLPQVLKDQSQINKGLEKDLKDLKAEIGKLKVYTSFADLGLGNTPTISQVANAMKDNSVLIAMQNLTTHIRTTPNVYTTLTINKPTSDRVEVIVTHSTARWFYSEA